MEKSAIREFPFKPSKSQAVDAGVKTTTIIFLGFSWAFCSPLGSWKALPAPYPSASLAAHWDEQDVPHQRRRLARLPRAQAAHLGEPHSPQAASSPRWGALCTQAEFCSLATKISQGKIRKLKKTPQSLCLLVRMKRTPEFAKNRISK